MAQPEAAPERHYTRLLSAEETCRRLGDIPLTRLARWSREGRITFVRLTNKTIAYPEDGVDEFIAQNLVRATRAPAPTLGKPKSEEHKRRIAEAQKSAWARRKAEKS